MIFPLISRHHICTAAATGLLLAGAAQAECIRMLVRDPSGLPVPGAVVRSEKGQSATTDNFGAATLCGLETGPHTVSIAAPALATVAIVAAAPGEQNIVLPVQPLVQSPVVVTGTFEPQQLAEVDRSIMVIGVDRPIVPGTSLTDFLKMDSAVDVRERGSDSTQADVGIRGGAFSQTLVLVNGIRVDDPQSGHHNMDLPLPLESISRMEVLHGSGSTLYGSDAVGGAVNVITRRPDAAELRLFSGFGDFGWNREAFAGGFRWGVWSQHVAVARDFSSGFRAGRDFRNLAVASQSFFDHALGSTSLLLAYNDRPFGATGFYGDYPSWERTGTKLIALSHSLGQDHRFQFSYRHHGDQYILYRYQPEIFQNRHTADSWIGSYTFHHAFTPKTQLTTGFEGLSESVDSTNLGDHQRGRGSAFFALQLRPTPRLMLTAGLREEFYRKWRGELSPTLSASLRLGAGIKARGALGRSFRVPTYTDLYYHDPSNLGNPNLRPESAWSYEGGLDWRSNNGATLSATWFERRERDAIDFVRPSGATIWQAMNFQRLNFHGAEFEWRQRAPKTDWVLSYTILRVSQELMPGAASRYAFNAPRNSLVISAITPLGRQTVIRTRAGVFNRSWQSSRSIWDVSFTTQTGRVHPFVQATNLLNTYYEAFPGLAQPGRWIRGGVQIELPGRR